MTTPPYPPDHVDSYDDDGTMPDNVADLAEQVVGHRIVSAEKKKVTHTWLGAAEALVLTLDTGNQVQLRNSSDCCAYTELESFLAHPEMVDHVITGVQTTDGYTVWHIFADFGDVLTMKVGWSCGNPFYYSYGFDIVVEPMVIEGEVVVGELNA